MPEAGAGGPEPTVDFGERENWGSKIGVVLAVAGSAVGLGNFLRFPGQAVNNGGGAFMIPYLVCFLLLGIPIAWCEWTMGRLGGRYRQNSGPGVLYALWRRMPSKILGAIVLLIPIVIYMYYILLEAWCLDYCIEFATGGFTSLFQEAISEVVDRPGEVSAIVGATGGHFEENCGLEGHGQLFDGGRMLWVVMGCFLLNFFIVYQGVTRGIERFCKWAMPLLIGCALVILVRVLTLPNISLGLGFMWNPKWESLADPGVWLAAAGQIFFSLSVGFGLVLCYASYLRPDDDVVLTSLSASSTNEFCEVILAGMTIVPVAFLFLGAENASTGTFGLGFITVPAIMHFMPGGAFFGALWFGLLFLAAVTSSLSMLQPAIAFLEDGFGLRRRTSVAILGLVTAAGTVPTMYFSKDALALDHTDFWCNLLMIVAATAQVLIFGWIIGAERGLEETNRGADLRVPGPVAVLLRYVTPTFLLVVLVMWSWQNLPDRLAGMDPEHQSMAAERRVYAGAIADRFGEEGLPEDALARRVESLLGPEGRRVRLARIPDWLREHASAAQEQGSAAASDARIARFVFVGIALFFLVLFILADMACRNRIGRIIRSVEASEGPP